MPVVRLKHEREVGKPWSSSPLTWFVALYVIGTTYAVLGGFIHRGIWPHPATIMGSVFGLFIGAWILGRHVKRISVLRITAFVAAVAALSGLVISGAAGWFFISGGITVCVAALMPFLMKANSNRA